MLVLTRKPNEAIRIGNDIRIVVIQLKEGDSGKPCAVRIGIEAPREVEIVREELLELTPSAEK